MSRAGETGRRTQAVDAAGEQAARAGDAAGRRPAERPRLRRSRAIHARPLCASVLAALGQPSFASAWDEHRSTTSV